MKTARVVAFGPLFFLLACGGSSSPPPAPNAASAVTADIPLTDSGPAASVAPSSVVDAGAATPVANADNPACGGSDVDLAAVLANKQCRPDRDAPPTPASATTDVKVTLTPSATTVKPGGHVDLDLVVSNVGNASIPLYFSGDLTLSVSVTDSKGKAIAPPAGNAPKDADPSCMHKDCRHAESHLLLAPGGKAHATLGWDAVKVAWPAKGPTTCCTTHVDPVAKGSLAAGTYKLKISLPYESNQGNPADAEISVKVGK
ncbi:MAG: DUF4232 domain-containing protein [Polyangiaceae bacterium]